MQRCGVAAVLVCAAGVAALFSENAVPARSTLIDEFKIDSRTQSLLAQERHEAALDRQVEVEANRQARIAQEAAQKARVSRQKQRALVTPSKPSKTAQRPTEARSGSGACGGSLPPCATMRRESGGDLRIWNGGCYAPVGHRGSSPCGSSSASGKWQFVRGTWANFGGFLNAADAPESLQDQKAVIVWAGGKGCGHWNACG